MKVNFGGKSGLSSTPLTVDPNDHGLFDTSTLFCIAQIGCFISSFILVAGHANFYAVWIGTCGLGFFLSSAGPTIISIAKEYVDLSSRFSLVILSKCCTSLLLSFSL